MKTLNVIVMVMFSLQIVAQENTPKRTISTIVQREDKLILNLTSDNWGSLSPEIKSKPFRSRGFSFLIMNERMIKTGNFGFGAGVGFMSQNVHTNAYPENSGINNSSTTLVSIPDSLYDINKLSLNFITAAIELRIHTNLNEQRERFKINLGFLAGYLVQSHTKFEGKYGKYKGYNIKNLNKLQYGLVARIGYSNYAINGYYSLVDVFKTGKGPELIPYSIGISFTF